MENSAPTIRSRGRPRSFDREAALDAATLLFWRHGYEGASIAQLAGAMGINPPSLYAAFGSKEGLYRACLQHYLGGLGDLGVAKLAEAATARDGLRRVLETAAAAFTRPGYPAGCMVGVGALRCAEDNRIAADETAALRKRAQQAFTARLQQAASEGEIGATADIEALSDFYSSVIEGMSVQAADGADRRRLEKIVKLAMNAWPNP